MGKILASFTFKFTIRTTRNRDVSLPNRPTVYFMADMVLADIDFPCGRYGILLWLIWSVAGMVAPLRSQDHLLPGAKFAPWNFRSLELSPRCSWELSLPAIRKYSFPCTFGSLSLYSALVSLWTPGSSSLDVSFRSHNRISHSLLSQLFGCVCRHKLHKRCRTAPHGIVQCQVPHSHLHCAVGHRIIRM